MSTIALQDNDRLKYGILYEMARRRVRSSHLAFMKYCWTKPAYLPFVIGFHTERICARIDKAIEDFRNGVSTYLRIGVHVRAGKTDIVSVYLPSHFIAEFPAAEVMQVAYNTNKATEDAGNGKKVLESEGFTALYPDISLSARSFAAGNWRIEKGGRDIGGRVYAAGLGAGLTGRGYSLGILDDYCRGYEDAQSVTDREKTWNQFTTDFLSRAAPVSITIVLATWWHDNDIHGRLRDVNDPEHEKYDPNFPVFETMMFPARAKDWDGDGEYPNEYLFQSDGENEESYSHGLYPKQWYLSHYASFGVMAPAIMDCNPVSKTGDIINVTKLRKHDSLEDFPSDIKYYRVWDYAHSTKQRTGADPDYTGGTLIGFQPLGMYPETKIKMWAIWVKDYVQFRKQAPERDAEILKIARGETNTILVENSVDSMDGAQYMDRKLLGVRKVIPVNCKGGKVERCDPVEPIFEAGNVHIMKGDWNTVWVDGLRRFDGSGKSHDEMVDNITCGYKHVAGGAQYGVIASSWG